METLNKLSLTDLVLTEVNHILGFLGSTYAILPVGKINDGGYGMVLHVRVTASGRHWPKVSLTAVPTVIWYEVDAEISGVSVHHHYWDHHDHDHHNYRITITSIIWLRCVSAVMASPL